MKNLFNHKGQHLSEYALIFSLIFAALIAMQTYIKRGLQGRYRDATDIVGSALRTAKGDSSLALQYEPYYVESNINTTQGTTGNPNTVRQEEFLGGSKKTTTDSTTTRTGYQKILPLQE